jgi:hypothetical protein
MNTPTRFSRDMTDADLSTHMQSVTAKGGVHVQFQHVKVKLTTTDPAKAGQTVTRLSILKQPKGDRSTVAARFISEDRARQEYPREFAAFTESAEAPTTGTPLSELPGLSASQIGMLVLNGLRSVEDLCEVSEDQMGQLGLDAIRAQKIAKAWMGKAEGASEAIAVADLEAKFKLQNDAMQRQFDAMTERNKQLEAQVAGFQMAQGGGQAAVTVTEPTAQVNQESDDLEYDIANMPDAFSEGPETAGGNDDLGGTDPDPLTGA